MALSGCMYTLDMKLQQVHHAYLKRMGYPPGWIAGPQDAVFAVDEATRAWLRNERCTLMVHPDCGSYWWAGTGKLP